MGMFDGFSWGDLLSSAVKSFVPALARSGTAMLADKLFPPSAPQFVQGPPPPAPMVIPPAPVQQLDLRTPEIRTAETNRLAAEKSRLSGVSAAEADLAAARAGTLTPDQSGALQEMIRGTRASQAARGMFDTGIGAQLESDVGRKYRETTLASAFDRLNALTQGYTTPQPMQGYTPPAPTVFQPQSAGSQFIAPQQNPWAAIMTEGLAPAAQRVAGQAVGAETPEQKKRREMQEQADIWKKTLYPTSTPPRQAY